MKIADDPVSGSFREQFVWCGENEVRIFPGPLVDITPLFPWKLKNFDPNNPIQPAFGCAKFGGVCSSKTCRDGHQALTVGGQ